MCNTLAKRIEETRIERCLTKTDVWKGAGVSSGAYAHWMNGSALKGETLIKVAKVLGVNPAWLETGKGIKNVDNNRANTEPGPNIKGEYPLISWIQAGEWMDIVDTFNSGDAEAFFASPKKCSEQTFMLRVRGRSMEPKYQDGDLIYVDPAVQYQHGSNVVVKLVADQEATFKRLVIDGNKQWLEPLNPDWPEKAIQLDENARIIGVVIGKFVPD